MDKLPDDVRTELWANFDQYKMVYFATTTDNQPKVRPLTMVPLDAKFWILTGTSDAKMEQIDKNKKIEVCLPIEKGENTGYARFSGNAVVVQDKEIKTSIAKRVDYFKHYWKSLEDLNYTLLEMDFTEVEYMKPGDTLAKKYSL